MILNSPNNPTGAVYPASQLQEIAEVCLQNNIIVISDEIYAGVNFSTSHPHTSLSLSLPSQTIVTGGLSKLFAAGGYRLGVALIPSSGFEEVHHGLKVLISETYSAVSAPIQWAAIKVFLFFIFYFLVFIFFLLRFLILVLHFPSLFPCCCTFAPRSSFLFFLVLIFCSLFLSFVRYFFVLHS